MSTYVATVETKAGNMYALSVNAENCIDAMLMAYRYANSYDIFDNEDVTQVIIKEID